MASILIAYSTTDGQTRKICDRVRQRIEEAGHRVHLADLAEDPHPDPSDFDRVVIGASIRYGRHSPRVVDFIERNRQVLEARPNLFFSVNLVARKPGKDQPETNPYMQRFLKKIDWRPRELAVVAGKLDYPHYGPVDRAVIRLIMWMTKGPTDPQAVVEYTDWDRVDALARRLAGPEAA